MRASSRRRILAACVAAAVSLVVGARWIARVPDAERVALRRCEADAARSTGPARSSLPRTAVERASASTCDASSAETLAAPAGEGARLEVRVVGASIGEVDVVLRAGVLELARRRTLGGLARFEGLAPGEVLVRVDGADATGDVVLDVAPGEAWHEPTADGTARVWRRVPLARGATERVELRLAPAARLAGVVRDAEGAPVASAAVLVQDLRLPARVRTVHTDDRGGFELAGLAPSRYAVASSPAPGPIAEERVARPSQVELGPGESAWLELRLGRTSRRVEGLVLDPARRPVGGVRIVCSVTPGGDGAPALRPPASLVVARALTDETGAFRIEGVPEGELLVAVDGRETSRRADGARRLARGFAVARVAAYARDTDLGPLVVEPAEVSAAGRAR